MKVTQRDKRLLYFVGIVLLLVVFIQFLILPAISKKSELDTDLVLTEDRQTQMQAEIAVLDWIDTDIEKNRRLLERNSDYLYDLMTNDQLDDLVTGLELRHALTPLTLEIQTAAPVELSPYYASELAQQESLDSAAAPASQPEPQTLPENEQALDTAVAPATDYLLTAIVSGTATGSREDFIRLLDSLDNEYPAIRVVAFSFTDSSHLTQELTEQVSTEISFSLEVYTCDKEDR